MDLPQLLVFAKKMRAAELRLSVNKPPEVSVDGKMSLINLPSLDSEDFEQLVENLAPLARESLRTTGRCETTMEIEGVGQVRTLVETGTARMFLPPISAPATKSTEMANSGRSPGAVPTFADRLRNLFGRKR